MFGEVLVVGKEDFLLNLSNGGQIMLCGIYGNRFRHSTDEIVPLQQIRICLVKSGNGVP